MTAVRTDLPKLIVNIAPLRDRAEQAREALVQSNAPPALFRRGGQITDVSNGVLRLVGKDALRGRLTRVADFVTVKMANGTQIETICNPPTDVIRDLLSVDALSPDFPEVRGVTQWPIAAPNGDIRLEPGYCSRTQLIYLPGDLRLVDVPPKPSADEIKQASEALNDIFSDFPFRDQPSRANALAAVLTVALRPAIEGQVPMFAIDAPDVGTGKTLIASTIVATVTGKKVPLTPECQTDEEWSKMLTSMLLEGCPVMVIDNVTQKIKTPMLATLVTTPEWKSRILGKSEAPTIKHSSVVLLTGNDLTFSVDIERRVCFIQLEARQYRAFEQDRQFRHPQIVSWVIEERPRLLAAIFTLFRGWHEAGCPRSLAARSMGGFEEFAHLIGGILEFAGIAGFLQNTDAARERSTDGSEDADFLVEIHARFPTHGFTAGDVVNDEELMWELIVPHGLTRNARAVGKYFSRIKGRRTRPDGLRIEEMGKRHNANRWHILRDVEPGEG